jgi:heterotetrameric sarcosine oxidase gamma subunit
VLRHWAALDECVEGDRSATIEAPGLLVTTRARHDLLLLQGDPEDVAFRDAVVCHVGFALPGPQCSLSLGGRTLMWMTPREWLLDVSDSDRNGIHTALTTAFAGTLAAVTDVSHALACFELSGPRVHEVLMAGCRLDLTPAALDPRRAVCTLVADIPTIVWRRGDSSDVCCLVDRSYAGYFRTWVACACASVFGY